MTSSNIALSSERSASIAAFSFQFSSSSCRRRQSAIVPNPPEFRFQRWRVISRVPGFRTISLTGVPCLGLLQHESDLLLAELRFLHGLIPSALPSRPVEATLEDESKPPRCVFVSRRRHHRGLRGDGGVSGGSRS